MDGLGPIAGHHRQSQHHANGVFPPDVRGGQRVVEVRERDAEHVAPADPSRGQGESALAVVPDAPVAEVQHLLAAEGINIQAISTSEIKVSCLMAAKYTELAVRALHTGFGLDRKDVKEEGV